MNPGSIIETDEHREYLQKRKRDAIDLCGSLAGLVVCHFNVAPEQGESEEAARFREQILQAGEHLCDWLTRPLDMELRSIELTEKYVKGELGPVAIPPAFTPNGDPALRSELRTQMREEAERRLVELTQQIGEIEENMELIEEQRKCAPEETQASLTVGVTMFQGQLRELRGQQKYYQSQLEQSSGPIGGTDGEGQKSAHPVATDETPAAEPGV